MTPSGNLLYIREPSATGQTPRVTRMAYDKLGRHTQTTLPDGTQTHTAYDIAGNLRSQWGSQTYPQRFAHDQQGRRRTLETWRTNAPTGDPANATTPGDITTWHYDSAGRLAAKEDAQGRRTNYTHTPAGRLAQRQWARNAPGTNTRLTTTYHHARGHLTAVTYNDNGTTPSVDITYDDLGRPLTVSNTLAATTYTYAPDFGVDEEEITYSIPGQPAFTRVLDRATRSLGRDTGWELQHGATVENSATYTYHPTEGRLEKVFGLGAQEFTYGYFPHSSLIQTVTGPAHTVTNSWEDHRDLLLAKNNHLGNPAAPVSKFNYDIPKPGGAPSGLGANEIGQREKVTTTGTAFATAPANWTWDYDSLGQLTTAAASTPDNSRAYQYDAIGNRKFFEVSNHQISNPPQAGTTEYGTNPINQYTSITTGGTVQLPTPTYDYDGNQTSGPLPADPTANATLRWDAENRLIEIFDSDDATLVRYYYDSAGRRIATISSGATTTYLYDGWNRIAEYQLHDASFDLHASFTWGCDLSGTMQGAGGVGGLLAVRLLPSVSGSSVFFPTYDGNGNISEYLDGSGAIKARYQYDPFGNTIALHLLPTEDAGLRSLFSYRFSTKPIDSLTGLYDYGYRWYDPLTGRWKSRDSMNELGRQNLHSLAFYTRMLDDLNAYVFLLNRGELAIDLFGLGFWSRVGNAISGAIGGAISGAVTGGIAGAVTGLVVGGPAGALAGLVVGAKVGAVAGAVAGAAAGFMHDEDFDPGGAALDGAIVGAPVGAIVGVGAVHVGLAAAVAASTPGNPGMPTARPSFRPTPTSPQSQVGTKPCCALQTNHIPIQLSRAKFGHTFVKHGQDATSFVRHRAAGSGEPKGQFLNDQVAARLILENLCNLRNGPIVVPIPKGFPARVVMPDGTIKPASGIKLVPSGDGVRTAYPVL